MLVWRMAFLGHGTGEQLALGSTPASHPRICRLRARLVECHGRALLTWSRPDDSLLHWPRPAACFQTNKQAFVLCFASSAPTRPSVPTAITVTALTLPLRARQCPRLVTRRTASTLDTQREALRTSLVPNEVAARARCCKKPSPARRIGTLQGCKTCGRAHADWPRTTGPPSSLCAPFPVPVAPPCQSHRESPAVTTQRRCADRYNSTRVVARYRHSQRIDVARQETRPEMRRLRQCQPPAASRTPCRPRRHESRCSPAVLVPKKSRIVGV